MMAVEVGTRQRWVYGPGEAGAEFGGCPWYALAALDDVATSWNRTHPDRQGEVAAWFDAGAPEYRWPRTYLPFVERLRKEAAKHPGVLTTVIVDELNQMVEGPDTALHEKWNAPAGVDCVAEPWVCQGAHWTPEQVAYLGTMLSGTYRGLSTDAFGRVETDLGSQAVCDDTGRLLSGNTLALWGRINDVGAARHVVPAAVLGMPADPTPSGADPGYDLDAGDGAMVRFDLVAPTLSSTVWALHTRWKAELSFLYATGWQYADPPLDLDLAATVNGARVDDGTLLVDPDRERVNLATMCIGGPDCATSAWSASGGATNTVRVKLTATATVPHNFDRTAYVWGLRVRYVDTVTGQAFWNTETTSVGTLPRDAVPGAYSGIGTPGGANLATYNAAWRFEEHLDGVVFTHDIAATWNRDAWERFLEHACAWLHETTGRLGQPVGCNVDERVQVSDFDEVSAFDLGEEGTRLRIDLDEADGVLALHPPAALENLSAHRGHFTRRHRFSPDVDGVLVEPTNQETVLGEVHDHVATIPAGCAGDLEATDVVHARWTNEGGGASWIDARSDPMVDAHACLVCVFQNWSTFTRCRSGASPACF